MSLTTAAAAASAAAPLFSFQLLKLAWSDIRPQVAQSLVPPLLPGSTAVHKGSMGRIAVVGGSKEYSGAPYYAAISALRFGADLSWVFCSQLAALPIKSYSPELMVTPFYDDLRAESSSFYCGDSSAKEYLEYTSEDYAELASTVTAVLPRLHSLVIGPGLGRNKHAMAAVAEIIRTAKQQRVPMVIDADGLWLLSQNISAIIGCSCCILTPNKIEFERLVAAAIELYKPLLQQPQQKQCSDASSSGSDDSGDYDSSAVAAAASALIADLSSSSSSSESKNSHLNNNSNNNSSSKEEEDDVLQQQQLLVDARRVRALSVALGGVAVLRKGAVDLLAVGGSSIDSSSGSYSSGSSGDSSSGGGGSSSGIGSSGNDGSSDNSNNNSNSNSNTVSKSINSGNGGVVIALSAVGSPRRCGGQGDVLAGSIAVALHWAVERSSLLPELSSLPSLQQQLVQCSSRSVGALLQHATAADGSSIFAAAVAAATTAAATNAATATTTSAATATTTAAATTAASAATTAGPQQQQQQSVDADVAAAVAAQKCAVFAAAFAATVVRTAGAQAFAQRGRSMTAPDVIEQLGKAFQHVHPEG